MKLRDIFLSTAVAAALVSPAAAQWQTPAGTIPVGRGSGVTGFATVAGSAGTGAKCLIDTAPPTFGLCGTAGAIQVGVTQVLAGTNTAPLWNNAGILANSAINSTWSTWQSFASGSVARTVFAKNQEIIRSVFDFGAVCDGSTDDTAAFQAGIDSFPQAPATRMGGTLSIPGSTTGLCFVNGTLTANAKSNINIVGEGSGVGANAAPATILVGVGAVPRWFDARDGHGIRFKDLNIIWNNPAFVGILIDSGGNTPAVAAPPSFGSLSDNFQMENVKLTTGVVASTATILNLNQSQNVSVKNSNFSGGGTAITGADIITGSATTALFQDVKFIGQTTQPVLGCGDSWHFLNVNFQPRADNAMRGMVNNTIACRGVTLTNPWAGDSIAGGGTWVQYFGTGLTIQGGVLAGNATGSNVSLASNTSGVNIRGVFFFGGLNGINFNNVAITGCDISANVFSSITNNVAGTTNVGANCRMDGNQPSISRLGDTQIYIGQAAGTDPTARTLSGDITNNNTGVVTIANNAVSNAKLRDSGALSVIGRSANSAGDPADISATAGQNRVLRETGSTLAFGTIPFAITTQTFCASGCTTTIAGGGSGTYTPTANLLYATIECVGGGGGGGGVTGAASQYYGGGGGGSGSYCRANSSAASIGASQTVNIGAGGAGGVGSANGSAGGATSVGSLCTTNGGGGGLFSATGVQLGIGGLGGAVGTGSMTSPGNAGAGGSFNSSASNVQLPSGVGGASFFGGAPRSAAIGANSNGQAGERGSGGSGAYAGASASSPTGGAGGAGFCVITEYVNQ